MRYHYGEIDFSKGMILGFYLRRFSLRMPILRHSASVFELQIHRLVFQRLNRISEVHPEIKILLQVFTVENLVAISLKASFQIDALRSAADWLIFEDRQFDWLRPSSS